MLLYDKLILRARIIEHEGYRQKPYKDSLGNVTIGIGHNIDANGLTHEQIERIFEDDVQLAIRQAEELSWYRPLSPARQTVIVELIFNMGLKTLLTFNNMRASIKAGNFAEAAEHLKDSLWYRQVGRERGDHLINVLKTGHQR